MLRPLVRGAEKANGLLPLSEHLAVYEGPINVGVLHRDNAALLFDCGDGTVAEALPALGVTKVERILFTHHHRDQACGASRLLKSGVELAVPEAERAWFDNVEIYWNDPKTRWDIYNFHPHRLMLAESVPADAVLQTSPGVAAARFTVCEAAVATKRDAAMNRGQRSEVGA